MYELLILYGILGALAAILASVALWAPRRLWVKLGALAVVIVFLPAGYFGLSEMLSRPKPVSLELARKDLAEAAVVGTHLDEGKAIYLWLGIPGTDEPRAYALPWDQQLARQLQGAERESRDSGAPVHVRKPFENSLDDREKRFYAAPRRRHRKRRARTKTRSISKGLKPRLQISIPAPCRLYRLYRPRRPWQEAGP